MTGSVPVPLLVAVLHGIGRHGRLCLFGAWLLIGGPSPALADDVDARVWEADRAYQRGDFGTAEDLLERAIASAAPSQDAMRAADLSMKLARVLRAQGRLGDAAPLLQRVVAIRIEQLGEDDLRTKEASFALRSVVAESGGHLHEAARRGDLAAAQRILASRPDAHAERNANGDTPLHAAAEYGRKAIVEFLLARGADIDATNAAAATPLHSAAMARRHSEVAEILVGLGMPIDHADLVAAPITSEKVAELCSVTSCGDLPLDDRFDAAFAGTGFPHQVQQGKVEIVRRLLDVEAR